MSLCHDMRRPAEHFYGANLYVGMATYFILSQQHYFIGEYVYVGVREKQVV